MLRRSYEWAQQVQFKRTSNLGDVIIPVAAVPDDGTTKEYASKVYPAPAGSEVAEALKNAAEETKVRYHVGMVRTTDAFYGASDFDGIVERYQELGILSFEMECAAVFTVAKLRGLKAGAVLGVVRNIVTEKLKFSIFSSLTL